jgi:polyhydroxyalkanoate synthesis regulator phasin
MSAEAINKLYELAGCNDAAIAGRAQQVLQLTEAVNKGDITPDEYQELCRDLVRMDTLDRECNNVEFKTVLFTAVWVVAQLA